MGIWEFIISTTETVKRNAPDLKPLKDTCRTSYGYGSAVFWKIDNAIRVNGLQKLKDYMAGEEGQQQINLFASKFAQNAAHYALEEGCSLVPGGKTISKIVSKTVSDVKSENRNNRDMEAAKEGFGASGKISSGTRNVLDRAERQSKGVQISYQKGISADSAENLTPEEVPRIFTTKEFIGTRFLDDLTIPPKRKMERKLLPIDKITPRTKNWTAKVQVLERTKTILSERAGSQAYQRLKIIDESGNIVRAILFDNSFNFFRNKLNPGKRYFISNANVKFLDKRYATYDGELSWTFDTKTLVEEIPEIVPPMLPDIFLFKTISQLHKHVETEEEINIYGAMVHAFPAKTRTNLTGNPRAREFIFINQEKKPIIFTLWEDFESEEGTIIAQQIRSFPTIAALNIKISSYKGMRISTKYQTTIMMNPPIRQVAELKVWCAENRKEIDALIAEKTFKDLKIFLPPPNDNDIISISKFLSLNMRQEFWIQATAELVEINQNYVYNSCPECENAQRFEPGWPTICTFCQEQIEVEARFCVQIRLSDNTGSIDAVFFGGDAAQLLPFTALQMFQQKKNENIEFTKIQNSVRGSLLHCLIKENMRDKQRIGNSYDPLQKKFNVTIAYKASILSINPSLLATPSKGTRKAHARVTSAKRTTSATSKKSKKQCLELKD